MNPDERTRLFEALRRFAKLARGFLLYGRRHEARLFAVLLLVLSGVVGVVQLFVSYAGRDFMTALSQKDVEGFWRTLVIYVGTFALAVPVGVVYRYCAERLALLLREWLTQILVSRFFYNRAYYRLRHSERVDNPDQRISEDVRSFTTSVLGYLLTLINSAVTLFSFTGVLLTISWKLPLVLIAYAGGGTLLSILIGRRLVGLHFAQNQKEANFRYALVRVRDNAESIAFFRGEKREKRGLGERFTAVVQNTMRIIGWNMTLGFFTNGYNYLAIIVPLLVVGPMFMQSQIEFGVVTQAQGAFASVLMALSVVVAQFEGLSMFAAAIKRLGGLWQELDEFDFEDFHAEAEPGIAVSENTRGLRLRNLTIRTPDHGKTLTRKLDYILPPGRSVLIMGESGCGKSSLLRTIAGLWQSGEGTIERPNINCLIFLPQRPYLVHGSLREQLFYPRPPSAEGEGVLREAIATVHLRGALDSAGGDLDRVEDWTNILSLGEQQRISFARIFLNRPLIAFLDEATSALDEASQRHLYAELRKTGISYVSVGHRSSLKEYHDDLIVLDRQGGYTITELPGGEAQSR